MNSPRWDATVTWSLDTGSVAATTLGRGDVHAVAPARDLGFTFVMAGRIGVDDRGGFSAYWMGDPGIRHERLSSRSPSALEGLRGRFEPGHERPYRLFIRPSPNARDGGAATRNGFILETGTMPPIREARNFMFAHEIAHHFLGGLDGEHAEI